MRLCRVGQRQDRVDNGPQLTALHQRGYLRQVRCRLANKWALYVLGALRRYERPMRFSALRRLLDGITQKMLTQTLRALERDGLISRTVYPTVPPRVEYGLTPLGVEVGQLTNLIADWSQQHVREIMAARKRFDERATVKPAPV